MACRPLKACGCCAVGKPQPQLIASTHYQYRETSTMRRLPGSKIQAGEVAQTVRKQRPKPRRFDARVDRLEGRDLMAGGSVVLTPGLVTITPSSTGPNVAIVSYQNVSGTRELDVNLNGVNHYFGLSAVGFVYYEGSSVSGADF